MSRSPYLVAEGLTKSFGTLKANDRVDLSVERGTAHAILGENGAGKSTLMNTLYGLLQPDEGRILIDGEPVQVTSPSQALRLGIGMVHQHFMLVEQLTVTENIVLGLEKSHARLDLRKHERRLTELSEQFGFDIDPTETVSRLPVGMQQRVEILRALYREANVLILDEPTSVLTVGEIDSFFDVLRKLRDMGKAIIFITHKLDEVMAIGDRVTVMREGRVTDERDVAQTSREELARLMVGREILFEVDRPETHTGETLVEVRDLHARNERGLEALQGMDFTLREGEILAFAGVDGNGQAELAEAIAGLRPYHAGSIRLDGTELTGYTVSQRCHDLRIGYVPEDRQRTGLVMEHSVAYNLMLRAYNRPPIARHGVLLDFPEIFRRAEELVERYQIRVSSIHQPVHQLSGGNQQKIVLAREIEADPRLLVVAQPCKGLDIGAIEFVQNTLIEARKRGTGILYISTELEHIFDVADRIAVLFQGRITGTLKPREATSERLGKLMAGIEEDAA